MKCALVGSRFFGASVFEALRKEEGIVFTSVVAPAADDRLALAARAAGLAVHVLENPKIVPAEAIAEGTDLIIAAHTHARVSNEALARSRLGGIGYHPSPLPRHRGIAAVEWTILEGDPIAGGSNYHLPDRRDAGAIAAPRGLGSSGLRIVVNRSDEANVPSALRSVELELVGDDRLGIVSNLTRMLAERGVSIESIHTEIVRGGVTGRQTFRIGAHLLVPADYP